MKKYKFLLSFIGIFILIYLLYMIDLSKFLSIIKKADIVLLLLSLIPTTICIFLRGLRWWLLTESFEMKFPYRKAVIGYMLGASLGGITPARLGNFIRIKFLTNETKKPIQNSILNIVLDNLIDLITMLLVSAVTILLIFYMFDIVLVPFFYLILFVISIVVLAILIVQRKKLYLLTKPAILFLVPSKYKEKFSSNIKIYDKIISDLNKHKYKIFLSFIINLIIWMLFLISSFMIALALGLDIGITYVFIAISIPSLISLLPISISGIGTREAATIFLLSLIGISPEMAISFSLMDSLLTSWFIVFLGGLFWIKKNPLK